MEVSGKEKPQVSPFLSSSLAVAKQLQRLFFLQRKLQRQVPNPTKGRICSLEKAVRA
jgi:hypothetical protein